MYIKESSINKYYNFDYIVSINKFILISITIIDYIEEKVYCYKI